MTRAKHGSYDSIEVSVKRLHAALEFLDYLRRLQLPVRTAKPVLSRAKALEDKETIICKQTDLAFTLGVSRVSMGKTLKSLQKRVYCSSDTGAFMCRARRCLPVGSPTAQ